METSTALSNLSRNFYKLFLASPPEKEIVPLLIFQPMQKMFVRGPFSSPTMLWYNIPPKLVVNVDQMGCYILLNSLSTWHAKGDKQVDIIAKEEKHTFTLLVASTPNGNLLSLLQVQPGKTTQSLPSKDVPGIPEAKDHRIHFTSAASKSSPQSYFSTLKKMREWITQIYLPRHVIETDFTLDKD
ncbi:hypothetical protein PQX77_012730 [Marasmius sp. AFHP31]|nr:hypothetical protein PQX77_012730 [Marasmius sp. AFHP31]